MTDAPGQELDADAIGREIQRRLGMKTSRHEPLARFTTMRVGGTAELFATAHNVFELRALIRLARARGIPHLLLGRGSNVVISDRGVRGLVIQVRAEGHRVEGDRLVAEAGVPMARAATVTADAALSGLEFGLAIPGTVGGAVWANAGAHGHDVASVLETADVLLADGREVRMSVDELGYGYRESRFKHPVAGMPPDLILGAAFRLTPRDPAEIRAELDEIRRWRREHQPLGMASAGSIFRNPEAGPSAGERIDRAGLKGTRIGGAMVSERHANFIVSDRRGRAADVRRLIELVRDEVERRDGVRLQLEVELLGDWTGWPWPEEGGA